MIYLDLLIGFFKVGLFSFGGAYAAIPLIRDVVLTHGWMNDEMVAYMVAISESTPGPIMVNMATYVGSTKAGVLGAIVATTAVVLPAFLIIILLLAVLNKALQSRGVQAVLGGLKPCIMGIILATGIYMIWGNCFITLNKVLDVRATILTAALALIFFGVRDGLKKKFSPILLICISAVLGMVVFL